MIKAKTKVTVIPNQEMLPLCWVRIKSTKQSLFERINNQLYCVGPNHELHSRLITCINKAESVILLSSFLLTDTDVLAALENAHERQVRIYILTATENQINRVIREDDQFSQDMHEIHKHFLDTLAEKATSRTAEHFHAKFVLADPINGGEGWLSTANFNKAILASVEVGVQLSSDQSKSLHEWFSWAFWKEAQHELRSIGDLPEVKMPPTDPLVFPRDNLFITTNSTQDLKNRVLDLIEISKTRLMIACYGFEHDYEIVNKIIKKAHSGVPITIFTRPRPAIEPVIMELMQAGAVVYAHDKLHAKAIVSDDQGFVMTANLETNGLDKGFEVGVDLPEDSFHGLVKLFDHWIDTFPWKFSSGMQLGECEADEFLLPNRGLREGICQIEEKETVHLNPVILDDLRIWDDPPNPDFVYSGDTRYSKNIEFQWDVIPPGIPIGSVQVFQESQQEKDENTSQKVKTGNSPYYPPRYKFKEQLFVVVKNEQDIKHAIKVADTINAKVVTK
jgi:cardiolipin synthase A/B